MLIDRLNVFPIPRCVMYLFSVFFSAYRRKFKYLIRFFFVRSAAFETNADKTKINIYHRNWHIYIAHRSRVMTYYNILYYYNWFHFHNCIDVCNRIRIILYTYKYILYVLHDNDRNSKTEGLIFFYSAREK